MKTTQINNKHYQECSVVILPTNSKSNIHFNDDIGYITKDLVNENVNYHLYILSDDEIKEGDWFIHQSHGISSLRKCEKIVGKSIVVENGNSSCWIDYSKKIIATTDSSLKDWNKVERENLDAKLPTTPQIPQSFIEYFISEYNKGNVISKVLVELQMYKGSVPVTWVSSLNETDVNFSIKLNQNEISILTEQKQETLEEASENWLNKDGFNIYNHYDTRPSFIAGAKWQAERMYSREEELKLIDKLLRDFRSDCLPLGKYPDYILLNFKNKWIEQNLK